MTVSLSDRLIKCFRAVFPGLNHSEAAHASTENVPEWDSLALINLIAVVEEEFQIQVQPKDYEELVSFRRILDLLTQRSDV